MQGAQRKPLPSASVLTCFLLITSVWVSFKPRLTIITSAGMSIKASMSMNCLLFTENIFLLVKSMYYFLKASKLHYFNIIKLVAWLHVKTSVNGFLCLLKTFFYWWKICSFKKLPSYIIILIIKNLLPDCRWRPVSMNFFLFAENILSKLLLKSLYSDYGHKLL